MVDVPFNATDNGRSFLKGNFGTTANEAVNLCKFDQRLWAYLEGLSDEMGWTQEMGHISNARLFPFQGFLEHGIFGIHILEAF